MSAKKSYSKTSLPTYEYMSPIWVRTACPVPQVKKRTKYAYHATIRLGVSAHRINSKSSFQARQVGTAPRERHTQPITARGRIPEEARTAACRTTCLADRTQTSSSSARGPVSNADGEYCLRPDDNDDDWGRWSGLAGPTPVTAGAGRADRRPWAQHFPT